jgi:thiamine-monophosphate kinase
MGEFESIRNIRAQFASLVDQNMEGIGDDCATIMGSDLSQLFTTDILVEGIHFLRDKISPYDLGRKSLSVSLSDIAAMGGTAQSSFLSVALPPTINSDWYDSFIEGYRSVSVEYSVPLLGGDTSRSLRDIVINVLVTGTVSESCRKCRKSGIAGDLIFVGSTLGNAACGLKLRLTSDAIYDHEQSKFLLQAQDNPRPQMALGKYLSQRPEVHAMMDVSDGIASDLLHILEESNVGAEIQLEKVPLSSEMVAVCQANGWSPQALALEGGEDYCLLFTAKTDISDDIFVHTGEKVYCIGRLTDRIGQIEWLLNNVPQQNEFKGFTHF